MRLGLLDQRKRAPALRLVDLDRRALVFDKRLEQQLARLAQKHKHDVVRQAQLQTAQAVVGANFARALRRTVSAAIRSMLYLVLPYGGCDCGRIMEFDDRIPRI